MGIKDDPEDESPSHVNNLKKRLTLKEKALDLVEQVVDTADVTETNSAELLLHVRIEKKMMKILDHELGETRDMFDKMHDTMSTLESLTRRVNDCEGVLFKTNIDSRRRLFEEVYSRIELLDN